MMISVWENIRFYIVMTLHSSVQWDGLLQHVVVRTMHTKPSEDLIIYLIKQEVKESDDTPLRWHIVPSTLLPHCERTRTGYMTEKSQTQGITPASPHWTVEWINMPSAFCLLPPKFTQRTSYVLQSSRCVYFLFHRGRCQAAKQPHKLQQVHIFQRGFDRRGRTSSSLGFFTSVCFPQEVTQWKFWSIHELPHNLSPKTRD